TPAPVLLRLRNARMERRKSALAPWLRRAYPAGLRRIVVRPVGAYLTFALVTFVGIGLYPQLGQSLFPGFAERDFLIHWVAPPGTSTAEMERSTTTITRQLLAIPPARTPAPHIAPALLP